MSGSIEGVGAPSAPSAFLVRPVTLPPAQVPAVSGKARRRGVLERAQRAMLPAYVITTLAGMGVASIGSALVYSGKSAARLGQREESLRTIIDSGVNDGVARERQTLQRQSSELDVRKRGLDVDGAKLAAYKTQLEAALAAPATAHNTSWRLTHPRAQFGQIETDELQAMAKLAERVKNHDYGFVIETVELPLQPGAQPSTRKSLRPYEVARALALHGRIYVGKLNSVPNPGSSQTQWVVDAKSAEVIMSYEALRSYLNLFR